MEIYLNSDNATELDQSFASAVDERISERLETRFGSRLTRVEVHVRDIDGTTNGPSGIEAQIEARPANGAPIVVKERAGEPMQAVNSALGTLVTRLDSIFSKADQHRR